MPDVDAEKVSLEPDSVSFMETVMARERRPVGLQNGFSLTSIDEDRSDGLRGGGTGAEDKEKSSTPPEQICPVGLRKAVLLYPALTCVFSHILLFSTMLLLTFNRNFVTFVYQ